MGTTYDVVIEPVADRELEEVPMHERRRVLDAIGELSREPSTISRHRKMLVGLEPPWDQVGPVWQLRVGDWRVLYDVDEEEHMVLIKAVRYKSRRTTGEIL